MKKINLSLFFLVIYFSCSSRDTTDMPNQRIGLSLTAEYVVFDDSEDFSPGVQAGVFYEKRIFDRLLLSCEIGLRFLHFTTGFRTVDNNRYPEYSHRVDRFQSDWNRLSLASSLSFRYYYLRNAKMYIELGGGLDNRLNKAPDLVYHSSKVYDGSTYLGEQFLPEGQNREDNIHLNILNSNTYARFEAGLGLETNGIDFGLFYRIDFVSTVSMRMRYSLF